MVSCTACNTAKTQQTKKDKISFHFFPRNANRRKEWLKFAGKEEIDLKKTSSLCSKHFESNCFEKLLSRTYLKKTAIPTIKLTRLKYDRSSLQILSSTANDISSPSTSSRLLKTNLTLSSTANDMSTPSTSRSLLKTNLLLVPTKVKKETNIIEASDAPRQVFTTPPKDVYTAIKTEDTPQMVFFKRKLSNQFSENDTSTLSTSRSLLKTNLLPTPTNVKNETNIIEASDAPRQAFTTPPKCISTAIEADDTPQIIFLKRKLSNQFSENVLKMKKIRLLQKTVWYQKKQIKNLRSALSTLKKHNILNEDESET
ncbi:uncharacterized protein [Diabrotica undecimpunctata]|uniref:uncharacterized protein n=1 Tax=Diabrotica undecimpunctata TaxID=50387 RepID=UPI003B6393D8